MPDPETTTDALAPRTPAAGQLARTEFGASELAVHGETQGAAVAAQAQAVVQARYVMAMRNRRDIDDVRIALLKECKRPGFAEVARYAKPVGGGKVAGFSIRFAEAAARCMRNVLCEVTTVWDDQHKRIVRVAVTDLESNLTYPKDVIVEKTVERKRLRQGQVALDTRINTYGEPVYILQATDDEVLTKENNLVSKALRNSILRLIPGDILDEAEAAVLATLNNRAAADPAAERKKLADAFAAMGVVPSDLKTYLGHDLGSASPAELVRLRSVYAALKSGETTWAEIVEEKTGDDGNGEAKKQKPGLAGVTEKLKADAPKAEADREPGSDDGDETPTAAADAPTVKPADCEHPSVPPSRIAATPKGKSLVCEECGTEIPGEAEPPKTGQRRLEED